MQTTSAIHNARDLSPELQRAVETLLGRVLQEDETVSVRAFKGDVVKEAPVRDTGEKTFPRLRDRVDKTAQRAEGVPEEEIDAAIDEAVDYVRRHRG